MTKSPIDRIENVQDGAELAEVLNELFGKPTGGDGKRYLVWEHEETSLKMHIVLVPIDKSSGDYKRWMERAIPAAVELWILKNHETIKIALRKYYK